MKDRGRIRQALNDGAWRAISLAFCAAMMCMVMGFFMPAEAATAHSVDEAISWCYQQVGQSIDTDGYPSGQPYQCVDLIRAYYQYLGASPVSGNGGDYTWNALPSGWTRVQGGTPQRGDILVYTASSSNQYGHVAIFEDTRATFHQNVDGAYVTRITYCNYNGFTNPYWGYIRPDFVSNRDPRGFLEGARGGFGTIRVWGWAIDDDTPDQPVTIHIYADGPAGTGQCIYSKIVANNASADVGSHRFDVTFSTDLRGSHTIYAHAINTQEGHNPVIDFNGGQPFTVEILSDMNPPTVENVEISDVSWEGYTVTCDVSDDTALDCVAFRTWTLDNGEDDLPPDWKTGARGIVVDGRATYRVETSAHNGETDCDYCTHIYAFDAAGNETVVDENICPKLIVHVPSLADCAGTEWQEADALPANVDETRVEVEYKNTYEKTAEASPGEGWTQVGEGTTTYVNVGEPEDSDFELQTSDTRQLVWTYYFHYCGASTGNRVNFAQTDQYTDYHEAGDANAFNVTGEWTDDDDPRYHSYMLKWKEGQWAGGNATCSAGRSAVWYRRYRYQNRRAVTNYKWVKETDWTAEPDAAATSTRVRYRLKAAAGYRVTYDANGGYGAPEAQDKAAGVALALAESCPWRPAFVFAAWDTEAGGTGKRYAPGDAYDEDADLTLYAQWTPQPTVALPAELKAVEARAFAGIDAAVIRVPEGCARIDSEAFAECRNLEWIFIPASVTEIARDAFEGCAFLAICAPKGSAAEQFAEELGILFIAEP